MRRLTTWTLAVCALGTLGACGGGGSSDRLEPTPLAVGAAFRDVGDGRIVLISKTGRRFVHFDQEAGTFTVARPISQLFPASTLGEVGASAQLDGDDEVIFSDHAGTDLAILTPATSVVGTPESLATTYRAPFTSTSSMFVLGTSHFMFNGAGSTYAARNRSDGTWSPTYSFATDFGGGGAPLANVGASFVGAGPVTTIYLFDQQGTTWTIYSGGGRWASAFTLAELGDGTLSFD